MGRRFSCIVSRKVKTQWGDESCVHDGVSRVEL